MAKVLPTRFASEEIENIDRLSKRSGSRSRSEFVREAVRYYAENVAETRVIEVRDVSLGEAKKEILTYLGKRKEAEAFDIANDLRLELATTLKALRALWEEGMVE